MNCLRDPLVQVCNSNSSVAKLSICMFASSKFGPEEASEASLNEERTCPPESPAVLFHSR